MNKLLKQVMCVVLVGLIASCASTSQTAKKAKIPTRPKHDWVMELRTEAATLGSALEVIPLQEPMLADLLESAKQLESNQKFLKADQQLQKALAINKDDPKIIQWRAELALAQSQWQQAHDLAMQSFNLGPKLGELCVRNQYTIAAFYYETTRDLEYEQALARARACKIDQPPRF